MIFNEYKPTLSFIVNENDYGVAFDYVHKKKGCRIELLYAKEPPCDILLLYFHLIQNP